MQVRVLPSEPFWVGCNPQLHPPGGEVRRTKRVSDKAQHVYGVLAHLVERNNGIVEVRGSSPLHSTISVHRPQEGKLVAQVRRLPRRGFGARGFWADAAVSIAAERIGYLKLWQGTSARPEGSIPSPSTTSSSKAWTTLRTVMNR